ncbi:uncharacterized protein METZ01_LOCUS34969 [marine metagenome]|uniref:Uncharacterized protein n=1 Tax=marine metagenome TaxID=408172 RepID=A0A381QRX3_9ZZZZ
MKLRDDTGSLLVAFISMGIAWLVERYCEVVAMDFYPRASKRM